MTATAPPVATPRRLALPVWAHLAAFALAVLIPLWWLLGFVAWSAVDKARRDYQQNAMLVARNLALELDGELAGFNGLLRALATSPALQDGDLQRFYRQAAQVAPEGAVIGLRDRSGQQLINTLFPYGTVLPVTAAAAVRAADECVMRTRAPCVSDLYIGTTDPQPFVLLNAPVLQGDEVRYALNVAIRARELASRLTSRQTPQGWAVAILDRTNRIVARSVDHDRFVGTLANAALREHAEEDEGSVRSVNVAGIPVWGAFVRLPSWGWRVAVGVPEAVLQAPLQRSLWYLAGAGVLGIGLSIGGALIYGRRLARPIHALSRMATDVGSERPAQLVSTSIRELDRVATTLAEAAIRLQLSNGARDRARAELQQMNATLQARIDTEVAARHQAQVQLAHAQRMEALGQLAGGIAHDFNNVLQAVQGGARLIQQQAGPRDRLHRLASMIVDASARGAAITRRLLAFARRADLRAEPIDTAEPLISMHEILQHTLGAGIEVKVHLAPETPPLLADKGQLETVLVNLASNARDAMAGAGTLTLSAMHDRATGSGGASHRPPGLGAGDHVRLSITDTGNGMDEATLARATDPFFTTKPLGKGTGLGLAMARGFAEQSGGALRIESAPGKGTTIRLWLPATSGGVLAEEAAVARPARATDHRRRILIVDDEPLVREIIAEGLEEAGLAVRSASTAADALELLAAGEPVDLLVTDLSMPGMDGLALLREAQRRCPTLPAILLTGFTTDMAELAVGGAVSGRFSLLRKPIDIGNLVDRVAVLLDASETAGRPGN